MKNLRSGKSAIICDADYVKIRKHIRSQKYKLLFDIAKFTGERWGAIIQLRVRDVYGINEPRKTITFRIRIRNATSSEKQLTREVPLHPTLVESLRAFKHGGLDEFLFPGGWRDRSISFRAVDLIFRGAVEKAGLSDKGYSTHSTRRTFITTLYKRGVDLKTIQLLTGHQDLKALVTCVELSGDRLKNALKNL